MTEVVSSIRRVTDIMGEISAASSEQSAGVSQVGEAVTSMDQTTQQYAALVEEMAAAASSLKSQANDLVQVVAVFKLGDEGHNSRPHTPSQSASAPLGSAAGSTQLTTPLPKAAVRATPPRLTHFAGPERRSTAASPSAAPAAEPFASAAKTSSRATPAGGDDDWETF